MAHGLSNLSNKYLIIKFKFKLTDINMSCQDYLIEVNLYEYLKYFYISQIISYWIISYSK